MKAGDAVKFIGFEGHPPKNDPYGITSWIGIVLRVYRMHRLDKDMRVNVFWPDGKIGMGLYEETLEVVSESR